MDMDLMWMTMSMRMKLKMVMAEVISISVGLSAFNVEWMEQRSKKAVLMGGKVVGLLYHLVVQNLVKEHATTENTIRIKSKR